MVAIHLESRDVDETFTVGGPDDDETLDNALGQVPDAALEELVPRLCRVASPAIRMVMMYHAALAHIDRNDLWSAARVTLTVRDDPCEWDVTVS